MEDRYATPQANLNQATLHVENNGSVEKALAGEYEVLIGETIKEAWSLVKGTKGSFLAAILIYGIIFAIVSQGSLYLLGINQTVDPYSPMIINQILGMFLAPLMGGLMMMGIDRSASRDISFTQMFEQFSKIVPLILVYILSNILIWIGMALLLIPGIYLAISYSFAMVLVLDKNMGAWQAMETSRKAVTKHWFEIFGFMLVMGLIIALSAIPLGIGLFWTIPLGFIGYGMLYRKMFGVSEPNE